MGKVKSEGWLLEITRLSWLLLGIAAVIWTVLGTGIVGGEDMAYRFQRSLGGQENFGILLKGLWAGFIVSGCAAVALEIAKGKRSSDK